MVSENTLKNMKKILYVAFLLCGQSFAQILSPLDKEWKNYNPDQKSMAMLDSTGQVVKMDLQKPISANDDPFITENVHYFLYTKEEPDSYEITKDDASLLQSSSFSPSRPTKVLIHGYLNGYQMPAEQELTKSYLGSQDVNIVAVDWKKLAAPYYNIAVGNTLAVGKEVAQLIDFLVSAGGANVSDIHILGHSLGAHVAAFTANNVKSGRITRISGLDPALPSFGDRPPARRLDPLDADIVDCIHTCGKYLGFYDPLCTHDFYPNGGVPVQPGCGFDWYGSCSHSRSYSLFASSIDGNRFEAQACSSFQEVEMGACSGESNGLLGELAPTTPAGLYFLKTSRSYPYAK